MAVQDDVTTITVSWNPSEDATGYRIDYNSSNTTSNSVVVGDGSISNYALIDLQNGDSYTISIVATSEHFSSEHVTVDMDISLGEKPYSYIHR